MSELKGNIFITTEVLFGWASRVINDRQPVIIGSKNFRYYLANVAYDLSEKYQIFIIDKISFPPEIRDLCLNVLKNESKNSSNEFVFWENMNSSEIAECIDGTIIALFEYNPKMTPYVYVDTSQISSVTSVIDDHRKMGIRNAGVCLTRSIGLTQQDFDMLYHMSDLPSPLFSRIYKNESHGVSKPQSGKVSNSEMASNKARQEMLSMQPYNRRGFPFFP